MTQETNLSGRAKSGAKQLLVAQLSKFLVNFIGLILLSRLLTPTEFGLTAIAVTIVGIGEIVRDLGLTSAAIRTPELTQAQRINLFWINSCIGIILALTLTGLAIPMSSIFNMEELKSILPAISLVFLFNGIGAQYRADLNRELRFSKLAITDILAPALSLALALGMAFMGFGYWAIVVQYVSLALFTSSLYFMFSRWKPRLPQRNSNVKPIVKFGLDVASSQVIAYLGNNIDTLVLGYYSNATVVGKYNRAFQLVMSPLNQLKSPAATVALPTLARIQTDKARLLAYLKKGQIVIGITIVPLAAILAGASESVVELALGKQWTSIASIVSILAIAGALQQLSSIANWIFVALGLGKDLRNFSLVSIALKATLIIICAPHGAFWVAIAYLTAVIISWPIAIVWATTRGGIQTRPLLIQAFELLIPPTLIVSCSFLTLNKLLFPNWLEVLIVTGIAAAVYSFTLLSPKWRDHWKLVTGVIKAKKL